MTLADIQRRVGVTPDGIWGPNTAAAVAKALDGQTDASSELVALATKHLNREEGRIPHAYPDSLGYWTIGVGRLIDKRKGGRLTNVETDMLLELGRRRVGKEGGSKCRSSVARASYKKTIEQLSTTDKKA